MNFLERLLLSRFNTTPGRIYLSLFGTTEDKIVEIIERPNLEYIDNGYTSPEDRFEVIIRLLREDPQFKIHGDKNARVFPALIQYCREYAESPYETLLREPLIKLLKEFRDEDAAILLKKLILYYRRAYDDYEGYNHLFFFARLLPKVCSFTCYSKFVREQSDFFKNEFVQGNLEAWESLRVYSEENKSAAGFMVDFLSLLSTAKKTTEKAEKLRNAFTIKIYNSFIEFWRDAVERHEITVHQELEIILYAAFKFHGKISLNAFKSFVSTSNDELRKNKSFLTKYSSGGDFEEYLEIIRKNSLPNVGTLTVGEWKDLIKLTTESIKLAPNAMSEGKMSNPSVISEYLFCLLSILSRFAGNSNEYRDLILNLVAQAPLRIPKKHYDNESIKKRNKERSAILYKQKSKIVLKAIKRSKKMIDTERVSVFKIRPQGPICVVFISYVDPGESQVLIWETMSSIDYSSSSLGFLCGDPMFMRSYYKSRRDYNEIKGFLNDTFRSLTQD